MSESPTASTAEPAHDAEAAADAELDTDPDLEAYLQVQPLPGCLHARYIPIHVDPYHGDLYAPG